jgi:hypothetical protein
VCSNLRRKSRKVSGASRCYFDIPLHPNTNVSYVYIRDSSSTASCFPISISTPQTIKQESNFLILFLTFFLSTFYFISASPNYNIKKMQSFFLTALLFTSTLAAPSLQSHRSMFKRQACDQANQPTADQVMTAINTWMIDIQTVNSFLDNSITQPAAVVSQAPNVLTFASDEPNELGEFLCPRFL